MATAARVAPIQPKQLPADDPRSAIETFYWLTSTASIEIPVPRFTVNDLLNLSQGAVVRTGFRVGDEVPLCLNKILLGRGQFEVVNGRLAIRITEIA